MAWPASTQTAVDAFEKANRLISQIKQISDETIALTSAGPVTWPAWERVLVFLVGAQDQLAALSSVTGIVPVARDRFGNQSLDVVAEFTAVTSALDACIQWMVNSIPSSGGYLLVESINTTTKKVEPRSFSSAATAGLRTELTALSNTIS